MVAAKEGITKGITKEQVSFEGIAESDL